MHSLKLELDDRINTPVAENWNSTTQFSAFRQHRRLLKLKYRSGTIRITWCSPTKLPKAYLIYGALFIKILKSSLIIPVRFLRARGAVYSTKTIRLDAAQVLFVKLRMETKRAECNWQCSCFILFTSIKKFN